MDESELKGQISFSVDIHEAAILLQNLPRSIAQQAKATITINYDLTGLPEDRQRFYAEWFAKARKEMPVERKVA